MSAAPETPPSKSLWWLESLLWSVAIITAVAVAAYLNETVREILAQGLAYLFVFLATPFVLETTTAFFGLCIVIAINNRRLEREGDGWVVMEIKDTAAPEVLNAGQTLIDKASEV
ncbi:MAG: hypothetical protein B7Z37_01735 [Verrucomicrobia bacterium 12-59-8]|nr:MAG: hypothetical protein B7Z37_01735 [Verrucomicrobia bacterium 12-59-8]